MTASENEGKKKKNPRNEQEHLKSLQRLQSAGRKKKKRRTRKGRPVPKSKVQNFIKIGHEVTQRLINVL